MSKTKIGVLISGSGTNLQSLIDNTLNGYINGEIKVVISNRRSAYGLVRAEQDQIEGLFISKKEAGSTEKFNQKIINELKVRNIDLVVLAGYMSILTSEFIQEFRNRIINIHPALIPSFCGDGFYGLKVHQAALDYGVKVSGATVHFVDEGTDTGPVILQKTVKVESSDDAETLQLRVLKVEHEILPLAVKLFCDNRLKVEQGSGKRLVVNIVKP